jgi:hypothetical protein
MTWNFNKEGGMGHLDMIVIVIIKPCPVKILYYMDYTLNSPTVLSSSSSSTHLNFPRRSGNVLIKS